MRTTVLAIVTVAALVIPAATMAEADAPAAKAPVIKMKVKGFGSILATPGRKALYFWSVEKDFKVHCTGACAKAWPPVIVKSRASVQTRMPGISGRFGVIKRPDGKLQLTRNRLPVYSYAHEGPNQVLCDDVDGWFVVRL